MSNTPDVSCLGDLFCASRGQACHGVLKGGVTYDEPAMQRSIESCQTFKNEANQHGLLGDTRLRKNGTQLCPGSVAGNTQVDCTLIQA